MHFGVWVKSQQCPQPGEAKSLLGLQLLSPAKSHLEWVWAPGMFCMKHPPRPHLARPSQPRCL